MTYRSGLDHAVLRLNEVGTAALQLAGRLVAGEELIAIRFEIAALQANLNRANEHLLAEQQAGGGGAV